MRQNYDAARGGYGEQVESPQMLQPLKSTDSKWAKSGSIVLPNFNARETRL